MNEAYRFIVNVDIGRESEQGFLCRVSVSDNGKKKKIQRFLNDDCENMIKLFLSFWSECNVLES